MTNITLNNMTEREYKIWKLRRDWPAMRYNTSLETMSDDELQNMAAEFERMKSGQYRQYAAWLDESARLTDTLTTLADDMKDMNDEFERDLSRWDDTDNDASNPFDQEQE